MNKISHPWMLVSLTLAVVLIPLNSTMIAVGLVPISVAMHVVEPTVVWAVTIYLVVMAALQPIAGKLGDIFGRRMMFTVGLGTFLLSSISVALIPHLWALMVFRAGQAAGGALMVPSSMAILRRQYQGSELRRVLGIMGLVQGMGAAVGPLLGAVLIHVGGWPAMFWINVPIALGAGLISLFHLPPDPSTTRRPIDYWGALVLAIFLSLIALSIPRSHHDTRWIVSVPMAIVGFGVFAWIERRAFDPVVRFSFFRNSGFRSANIAILSSNFLMYSTLLWMPVFLKNHGYSTGLQGTLLFLFSLSMSLMSFFGGHAARILGSRKVVTLAFVINVLVVLWYVGLHSDRVLPYIIPGLIVAGLGAGIGTVAMQATALESVPPDVAGTASGIYSTFRYVGSISASALVSLMVSHASLHWMVLAVATLLGLIIARGFPAATVSPVLAKANSS